MALYRLVMALVGMPFLLATTLVQRLRRRVDAAALRERLGFGPVGAGGLWLHGASNGELTSARWVLEAVLAARPGLPVLVTSNTATARAMVAAWGLPGVQVALAPLDGWGAPGRVIRRRRPAALVIVESELWPARLAAARGAKVPVLLIGARLSEKSARMWGRMLPGVLRQMLEGLRFLSAQDQASAERFVAAGLPATSLGPVAMLKARAVTGAPDPLPQPAPRSRVLLAASTHEGEEPPILQAYAAVRDQFDLLILAPRHPRRSAEVAAAIAGTGLGFARRSEGAVPSAELPVFLADTLGEMPLWYQMAGVTIIGGSFADKGGHTPFEPAAFGSAIVHGPSMHNFRDAARDLDKAEAARAIAAIADLAPALRGLDRAAQDRLSTAARGVLAPAGDPAPILAAILSALPAGRL